VGVSPALADVISEVKGDARDQRENNSAVGSAIRADAGSCIGYCWDRLYC
jgi:hypothetical protein